MAHGDKKLDPFTEPDWRLLYERTLKRAEDAEARADELKWAEVVVSQIVSRRISRIISAGTVLDSSDCLGFTGSKAWGDGVMSLVTGS